MKLKTTLLGIMIGAVLLTQVACSKLTVDNSKEAVVEDTSNSSEELEEVNNQDNVIVEDEDSSIMDEFEALISGTNIILKDVITFIQSNIEDVSEENASIMVLGFEEQQVNHQISLEERYFSELVQTSFQKAYQEGMDFNKTDELSDAILKELLLETKNSGFKLEQAEGYYYPVIDYSLYQQFAAYVTPDIKAYINIMTVESNQVFAKDAALTISWKEVINRILSQEGFLNNYSESVKVSVINELYLRYELISMFGLNNTPLFEYDTKAINEEAKLAYEDGYSTFSGSDYLAKLTGFMDIVKANNYILTEEVEAYRNENTTNSLTNAEENRYDVAGFDNASEFEETFQLLQELVTQGDKKLVAEYVAYPITVTIDGVRTVIADENKFIENYDSIMTEEVKNAFINQKVDETFVNYKGVMAGNGEIWFNKLEGTKHTYSIYGINN